MQTVVQVVCSRGRSLRDAIANDTRLGKHALEVIQEKKPGRSPGWTKVRSLESHRGGSMNIQWDGSTAILTCRVINRGSGRPNLIIGDFVDYLLSRYRRRIKLVNVLPG
ncbi:MAG TPA: hypothetical protein VLW25_00075 [Bryobacteraceae bacterium]|nr:hypothetical protein [Bryobacteraceae bacterium]